MDSFRINNIGFSFLIADSAKSFEEDFPSGCLANTSRPNQHKTMMQELNLIELHYLLNEAISRDQVVLLTK
jgi:hypothetical protein